MRRRRVRRRWESCCARQCGRGIPRSTAFVSRISQARSVWPDEAPSLTLSKEESPCSISFLHFLNASIHTHNLPPCWISSSLPFNHNRSFSNEASARDEVVLRRWSWSRVTEREELVGRIREVLRLPQYLEVVENRGR